ncbi:RidA family protein [Okeania sp.]|uniref:RidA family protein n=1 Tax=Okeania sp. TaxID=3100323 RepID=UPI002B4B4A0F|nr:RidA family protein [Okeania sp.]MEB3342049.1 RidA family protein [Okeania sp.]
MKKNTILSTLGQFDMRKLWSKAIIVFLAVILPLLTLSRTQAIDDVIIRHPIPGSSFPIARAVEVPSSAKQVYLSGQVPPIVNDQADKTTIAAFGDTETQTVEVLKRIQNILEDLDLTLGDVVKMQVFLVGDPALDRRLDFRGFMKGYTQFFGTEEQPKLPARSVMQVAGLANPGWLVEIEVIATRL